MTERAPLSPTPRTRLTRSRERARADRAELDALLDATALCHLGVTLHGAPLVVPTVFGRAGDTLYLHGSTGSGNMRAACDDAVCVTVTEVDGIVYARSAMHFSMNFRSAVIHGTPRRLTDPADRLDALRVIVEHTAPGSWARVRPPNAREMAATLVLALDLTEASVKVRTGGPKDDAEDVAAGGVWAGVLPVRRVFGAPQPSADLEPGVAVPGSVLERAAVTTV